ncbi:hypothetical protein ACFL7D_08695 [candidate division KSB1 bacterium]
MKKALIILLTLLFATTVFAQGSVWFTGSFDDAKNQAAKEGKLLLIDFYSDG